MDRQPIERILTSGPGGRILTHCNVWSPCGEWIAFDTRSDAAGSMFDGTRIQRVHVKTGEVRTIYESQRGACCGAVTWHPTEGKVAFILGPEPPESYGISRRRGIIVDVNSYESWNLDARDLTQSTPGALSGGSHVHIWHPRGDWIRFTYDDDVTPAGRCIAVAKQSHVDVPEHPWNYSGEYSASLWTTNAGGLTRACEECWVGTSRMIAFQGTIDSVVEVFVVEEGQTPRRLTHSQGIAGPRHWLQSDGERIAFLMKDTNAVVQLWTVTLDGELRQLTLAVVGVQSTFTWQGPWLAAVVDGCVSKIDATSGTITPLSPPSTPDDEIRPEACVLSPDGSHVAYIRHRDGTNHIAVTSTG